MKTLRVPNESRFVRIFALAADPGDILALPMKIGALASPDVAIVLRTREAPIPIDNRAIDLQNWEQVHDVSVLREELAQLDGAACLAYRVKRNQQTVPPLAAHAEILAVIGCRADSLCSRRRPWEIEPGGLPPARLAGARPEAAAPCGSDQCPAQALCATPGAGTRLHLQRGRTMITYHFVQAGCILREALVVGTLAPPVTVDRTCYVVHLNGTVHHVRRDRVCDCGGTAKQPCLALPVVREYLAAGGARPIGHHPDRWPANWTRVPPLCPVCDYQTTPDPYLNGRAGPGWMCSLTGYLHFWQVRTEPLRRYLKAHPPQPAYLWYGTSEDQRQAWLEAHTHLPPVAPTPEKGVDHALDLTQPREGEPGSWLVLAGLDLVRLSRGCLRRDDRLLQPGELERCR